VVCRLRILYLTDIQSSSLPSNRSSNVFYCMRYLRYFLRLVFSSQVGSDPPAPHVSTIYVCTYISYLWSYWVLGTSITWVWAWAVTTFEQAAPYCRRRQLKVAFLAGDGVSSRLSISFTSALDVLVSSRGLRTPL